MTISIPQHIEDVAAKYYRMRKSTSMKRFENYQESRREELALHGELLAYFEDDLKGLASGSWTTVGDDLTIEQLEEKIEIAEELKRLLRGRSHEVAHGSLPYMKKNLRTRKSLRDRWGADLPIGKLWNDRWDNDSNYRRVGTEAKIIRAWARREGYTVPERGAIPYQIVDAYVLAHEDKWSEAQVINHNGGPSVEVWCYQCASVHLHGETGKARGKHAGGDKTPHCHHRAANHYYVSDYTAPYPEPSAEVQQLREDAGL